VTPFHLGPGLLLKALAPRSCFSLSVFGFVQVVLDAEVVTALVRSRFPLHGALHTYVGASAAAVAGVIIGRPCCVWLKRQWNAALPAGSRERLTLPEPIPLVASVTGALAGAYSHVLLDSLMHADMMPLAPWTTGNVLLSAVDFWPLHLLCLAGGLIGALLLNRRGGRAA
jgi:hypothetical protein